MLEKLKAKDMMSKVPAELSPGDPAHWVSSLMEDHDACHLPVTINSQLLGVVSRTRAVAANLFRGPGYLVTLDFMRTNPVKVYPETCLRDIAQALMQKGQDCITVVSKRDELLGMIHARDVLRRLLWQQEAADGRFIATLAA